MSRKDVSKFHLSSLYKKILRIVCFREVSRKLLSHKKIPLIFTKLLAFESIVVLFT